MLDARRPEKAEGTIQRNTFGEAWTSDGFRTAWGKAFDRAKLADADMHFHDLRGTAVTRLALSGCSIAQLAAITGHSPRDVDEILKAHYLGGQAELAEQAIVQPVATVAFTTSRASFDGYKIKHQGLAGSTEPPIFFAPKTIFEAGRRTANALTLERVSPDEHTFNFASVTSEVPSQGW
ncbi:MULTISPECIES: hypothetical protein [unclassified Bradyrhizobium]